MWNTDKKAPIIEFLVWVIAISLVSHIALFFLEPYSTLFVEKGTLSLGYIVYAIIGILIATPNPAISTYIVLRRHNQIRSPKEFFRRIFQNENILKTILITLAFCIVALVFAIFNGIPTGSPWYMLVVALPVMIIGGGVEEIGWRGFLQPQMEKKFSFPIATIIVSVIWFAWHLPIWFVPTSNHYGDSLIGFGITIFVWAFVGAAIYKSTKSVFACVMYHSFINAIGAIYDWNTLFDAFPKTPSMIIYFVAIFVAAIILWVISDKKSRRTENG